MMQSQIKKKHIWIKNIGSHNLCGSVFSCFDFGIFINELSSVTPPKTSSLRESRKIRRFLARSLDKQLVYFTCKTGSPNVDRPVHWESGIGIRYIWYMYVNIYSHIYISNAKNLLKSIKNDKRSRLYMYMYMYIIIYKKTHYIYYIRIYIWNLQHLLVELFSTIPSHFFRLWNPVSVRPYGLLTPNLKPSTFQHLLVGSLEESIGL